jgi:mono/diheme cytochrome c family protein
MRFKTTGRFIVSENRDNEILVYLDNGPEPITRYQPPGAFELDTSRLEDGPHVLRIVAVDRSGRRGVRTIPFEVRNGPGIAVDGLREHDLVEGKISVLINAYGGAYEEKWEPSRAETPAPAPTWAWITLIAVVAWAMYYAVQQWNPPPQFANTPTYGTTAAQQPEEASVVLGARLYRISCANCHQLTGQGVPHVFPPLTGDSVVSAQNPAEHIRIVLFGKKGETINGEKYEAEMPAWKDQLSDVEIAAIVNFERTTWGNNAPTVTEEEVEAIRNESNE